MIWNHKNLNLPPNLKRGTMPIVHRMLLRRLFSRKNFGFQYSSAVNYSRKSDSNDHGCYKIVKFNDVSDDVIDEKFKSHSHWELYAPRGYRFLLPGSLGPAWHEVGSTIPFETIHKSRNKLTRFGIDALEYTAQECPILLRKGVMELFPNTEVCSSQHVTIITLTRKKKPYRTKCKYSESEYYAKIFILAAQEICLKLKNAGFWADFINPFSGKPYISPFYKSTAYETEERFCCAPFEIKTKNNCQVIQSRKDGKFIGTLFTNAPTATPIFNNTSEEH